MKQEVALLYNLTGDRLRRVKGLLVFMGVRVRLVDRVEYNQKVGALAGLQQPEALEPYSGMAFQDEMMVLRLTPARVNAVIQRFQKHGVALPALTAVLTASNAQWDSTALADELGKEREALAGGAPLSEHQQ
jgi:hypothetical protein